MSGTWLRGPTERAPTHECEVPVVREYYDPSDDTKYFDKPQGSYGDVWRCECGARWTPDVWGFRWRRTYWPWPRYKETFTSGSWTLD